MLYRAWDSFAQACIALCDTADRPVRFLLSSPGSSQCTLTLSHIARSTRHGRASGGDTPSACSSSRSPTTNRYFLPPSRCLSHQSTNTDLAPPARPGLQTLTFKTRSSVYLNRFDALNRQLLRKYANKRRAGPITTSTGAGAPDAEGGLAAAGAVRGEGGEAGAEGTAAAATSGAGAGPGEEGASTGATAGAAAGGKKKKAKGKKKGAK